MKRIILLAATALAATGTACGDAGTQFESELGQGLAIADIEVPGQERRIDGTVWEDGWFSSEEARAGFCAEHGHREEAWFCSDLGTASQPWVSAEYHGLAAGGLGACYGPNAINGSGDCLFPEKKELKLIIATTGCFDGPPPPAGPSTLQEQAILEGVRNGALEWDNNGVDVAISGTPGSSGYMPVTIDCLHDDPANFAIGGLSGAGTTRVTNAPVGVHSGKDQDDFRTIGNGVIHVNIATTWAGILACHGANPTIGNIKSWARYQGTHELGHVLGFAHFAANGAANIMRPARPAACAPSLGIDPIFERALDNLDLTAGGATVFDNNLQHLTPQ